MLRYHNYDVVFREIPGETTLAINLTNCPHRCPGCHSPHLREDRGEVLDRPALAALIERYGRAITCVCFMGGDAQAEEVAQLAVFVRRTAPAHLRTAWYSGRAQLPERRLQKCFDYIKIGPYIEALGPLDAPTTNQRLYRITDEGATDRTAIFRGQDAEPSRP
jgi:anaerobic ribonucleoside-triphosphate reductase activating protein